MDVQFAGQTYSVEKLVARQQAGAPMLFNEMMALRLAANPQPAAAKVAPIAPPAASAPGEYVAAKIGRATPAGRLALVAKQADGRETVLAYVDPAQRAKDIAWAHISKLAEAEREKNPALTREQATVAAMDSAAAAPLMRVYRHHDAHLTAGAWVAKRDRAPAAAAKRARVEQLAAQVMVAKGLTIEAARVQIWDTYPELRA